MRRVVNQTIEIGKTRDVNSIEITLHGFIQLIYFLGRFAQQLFFFLEFRDELGDFSKDRLALSFSFLCFGLDVAQFNDRFFVDLAIFEIGDHPLRIIELTDVLKLFDLPQLKIGLRF